MSLLRFQLPDLSPRSRFNRHPSFREEIQRFFDLSAPPFRGFEEPLSAGWNPPLSVFQNKDNVFVRLEAPGLKKEDVAISLHENALTVSGERKDDREPASVTAHRRERVFGRFTRSVTLPVPVNPGNVTAQYQNGVLTVTLSKSEEAKPRQIEVQVS